MLLHIVDNKKNIFWTVFHVTLGFLCTLTPFVLIGWFYYVFLSNVLKIFTALKSNKFFFFLSFFSYLISFEILDRMAKTSPFIPYELSKYLLVVMGLMGISQYGFRSIKGLLMLLLVTPAIFYDDSGRREYFDIINYYLGPVAVALGIGFANQLKINENQLNQILKLIWLGCLASLTYTIIKTPDFEEISFSLKANFETTGGHSSNQVSTVLGLGMFLSFYSIFKRLNFSGLRAFDFVVFTGFVFQGLLSFSRGGMMVGALAILFLFLFTTIYSGNGKKLFLTGILAVFILYGIFEFANDVTGGNLLLRYKGETQGTLLGSKELTADQFVTGRIGIFEKDVNLWLKNPIFGVGCGSSRYMRDLEKDGVAAHVELSRLLADHGLLGLLFALLFFIFIPLESWKRNSNYEYRFFLIIILVFAIATTFHAAMRTYVTPLLVIIGSLKVISRIDPTGHKR